mgnify:CR=1 FL=1
MYFQYDESATEYLKQKDKRLAEVINKIGKIEREVDNDLFSSVVHHIIGQQISTKAQATIWQRMQDHLGTVNADTILTAGTNRLQSFGMTFKKAEYITNFAAKVKNGTFDLQGIWNKSDAEVITELSGLKGDWNLDCRDDTTFLYAASKCFQLWGFSNFAGYAYGIPSYEN